MERVADDVQRLVLTPRDGINAYLLGEVLVDAGVRWSAGGIVHALRGRPVTAHALTHAHPDHAGGTKAVAAALGVPVWVGAGDAEPLARGYPPSVLPWADAVLGRAAGFPAVRADRLLREGDDLGEGFTVLATPGHSPGHVAFWRAADRTLVCGDVLFNLHLETLRPGLREPPRLFTPDPVANRAAIRRLAALEPEVVLFGHGPPLRDPARVRAFAERLPLP